MNISGQVLASSNDNPVTVFSEKHSIKHFYSLSRIYDERYRIPMHIARTDLVNFMIDDLVESSLGFLNEKQKKGQEKKNKKKCVILRCDIAFVLLKSILCIINIVDCIVRGYILYIYMVRARQLQEIKRRGNNSCTIS